MNMIRDTDTVEELTEETPEPIVSEKSVSAPIFPELAERAVYEAVGLETDSEKYKYAGKVGTLLEWVKSQTNELTPETVKSFIRELEMKVGSPPISERRVSYLARYAYLLMEERKLQGERKKMEQ